MQNWIMWHKFARSEKAGLENREKKSMERRM